MSLIDALLLDSTRINVWIALRGDGQKGSGTQSDPYNGSTADLLDSILDSIPASPPARIHLGSGEFLTRGYADGVSGGWQPKPGMKIVGAGVDVTRLKLTGAQDPGSGTRHYWAIGHRLDSNGSLMNYCEIADLTIDCNLGGQSGSAFACGAIRLMGHHAKVYRVKAVGWGTKPSGPGCQVIAMITADPSWSAEQVVNTGIEECIAVEPDTNTGAPVTVLHVGPKQDPGTALEGLGLAPYIRSCYVDCGAFTSPLSPDVRALSMSWCKGGMVVGNQIHRVRIGGPYVEAASGRSLLVRDNTYKNVRRGPYLKLGQKTGNAITVNNLLFSGASPPYFVTANIDEDHFLSVGDRVELDCDPTSLNGLVEVTEVTGPTQFKYLWPGASATLVSGTMEKAFGMGRVEVEGNTVELAQGADGEMAIHVDDNGISPQTPDHVVGDALIRDNRIRYVDDRFDPDFDGTAAEINGAKALSVQDNVIGTAPSNPLQNQRCSSVKYFNNRKPDGTLIRGFKSDSSQRYDELETEAEDALLLGLLNRR